MLKTTMQDIDELIPDPNNVRQHGIENHAALVRSIKRFGIRKPIVAHEATKIVYAGNETLRVALELGMTEIPVAWIPADVPESVCRAYAIADNRTTDLSEFDDVRLVEALTALQEDGEIEIDDVGFDTIPDKYEGDIDYDKIWQGMPEFEQQDKMGLQLIVHFENEQDRDDFAELVRQKISDKTKYIWYPAKQRDNLKDWEYVNEPDT